MTNSADFSVLTTPTRVQDGEFSLEFPDGWQQGRGAFGGLVVAALFRAARACEPEAARTLRTLSAEIVGPVQPGPAHIRVELLRRGTGVSTLAVRLLQGTELLAHAVVVFGHTRPQIQRVTRLSPPQPPPFDQVPLISNPRFESVAFTKFFEFRPTSAHPFTGPTAQPSASGWLRMHCPPAELTATELLALIDAWWPCALVTETAPRPMATLAFTFELLTDPARLRPQTPVYHRAEVVAAQHGYSVEMRELWSPEGELLALNQQTIVVIK